MRAFQFGSCGFQRKRLWACVGLDVRRRLRKGGYLRADSTLIMKPPRCCSGLPPSVLSRPGCLEELERHGLRGYCIPLAGFAPVSGCLHSRAEIATGAPLETGRIPVPSPTVCLGQTHNSAVYFLCSTHMPHSRLLYSLVESKETGRTCCLPEQRKRCFLFRSFRLCMGMLLARNTQRQASDVV